MKPEQGPDQSEVTARVSFIRVGMGVVVGVLVTIITGVGCAGPQAASPISAPETTAANTSVSPTASDAPSSLASAAPSPTAEPTVSAHDYALSLASAGATHNADWKPYTENINGVPMALVPTGCFPMGSNDGSSDERPSHQVCFEQPFWIDVYEVTQYQFTTFGGQAAQINYFKGADLPRDSVAWNEADVFCKKRGARLPTEAEWEYAARGPDGLVYPWGNDFDPSKVIYNDNSGTRPWQPGSEGAGASWVGANDMSGNMWEWVSDWYSETYYRTLGAKTVNPQGPSTGTTHLPRGGSFCNEQNNLRTFSRYRPCQWNSTYNLGLRCGGSVELSP